MIVYKKELFSAQIKAKLKCIVLLEHIIRINIFMFTLTLLSKTI